MKNTRNRLTALLLAFVMAACFLWDVPAHAAGDASSVNETEQTSAESAAEETPAVSESSGPAASPEGEGGAQSEAEPPASSEGQASEAPASEEQASEAPASEEQPSEEAKDSSSKPEEHYELEEQKLTADVYTDETRDEESDDGTVITVEGELPEDASVEAYPVEVQDFDGEKVLAAYDITIYGPDGGEFQPEDPVQVSISAPELKDADSVDIYHLKDAGDEEDDAEQEDAEEEDADGKETAAEEKDEAKDGAKDADAGAERDDADEAGGVRARVELDGDTKALNAAKVAANVKPKNKKVRFKAESFSIYVVAAAGSDDGGIDISDAESATIQVGKTLTLYDSKSWSNYYYYTKDVHWSVDPNNSSITKLKQNSNWNYGTYATVEGLSTGTATITCRYSFRNRYESWETANDSFTVTVDAADELTQVDTLDSKSRGVNLEMFDYGYSRSGSFSILNSNPGDGLCTDPQEGYTDGTTKEGLLQRVVGSDGFPHTIDAGHGSQQMSKWFTTGSGSEVLRGTYQPANYLFLKSNYDADGSFHYSSAENFAALNGATDDSTGVQNFTVYDKLGTPSNDTRYYYYKRGNFLPYNTINNMRESSNQNEYDLYGKQLDDDDPKKGAPLYLMDQQVNFHFGLYMNTDFLQPEGGLVPKDKADPDGEKKPMKFQFTGDDDLWVYIDGVLILDLGGIHDAQNGTIDFSTGVVTWTDTPTEPTEESKEPEPTSIKDMLDKAVDGNLPNGTRISKTGDDDDPTITYTVTQNTQEGTKTTDIVLKNTANGYTYEDYSRHTLQMFYMERGSGASNLAIDFNLQTVPKDSVTVTKQVKDLNPYWADQKEYNMQLYVEDEEGDYQLHRGEYTIGTETYSTGEDGTFSLKGDQRAVFSGIDVNKRYYVKEIDPDETDGISYKTTFSTGGEDCTDPEKTDQSEPVSVENEPDMTVTNTAQGTGSITVTKKLEGFTGDNFDAQFELWKVGAGSEADVEIQTASYDDFKDPDDNNGTKSYTFTGLPDGTYYVVETGSTKSTSGILKTTYTVGDSTDAKDDGKEAQVTLNGEQKSGSILITNTYYGEYTLPKAGGSGTLPFQIIGTVILLGAAAGLGFWLYRNKKKKGAPPKDSS
jgi:LPXTG-motif cell wall-anchored protein